jgi:hypothetical protein
MIIDSTSESQLQLQTDSRQGNVAAGVLSAAIVVGVAIGTLGSMSGGGGGVFPLIMGVQRFGMSSNLGVQTSEVQAEVTTSLDWASGNFGLISSTPATPVVANATNRRHLSQATPPPKALAALLSTLTLLGICTATVLVLHTYFYWYWKLRANKRYYMARKTMSASVRNQHAVKDLETKVTFRKFPAFLVFPNLYLVVFKLLATGLVSSSSSLIVTDACGVGCKVLACVVLVCVAALLALAWAVVTDFNMRFRQELWKPAVTPAAINQIDDPFYRLISQRRATCCRVDGPGPILNRSQGKFGKPPQDTEEPYRTERVLANLFSLRKRQASDLIEAYQFPFFPLASGKNAAACYFNVLILTAQLATASLSGLNKAGLFNKAERMVQARATLALQLSQFLFVWCTFPGHDRIDNVMFSMQLCCEAVSTAMLLSAAGASASTVARAQSSALMTAMFALFVPLLRRFYDGIIAPCIKLRRKGPFNAKAAALALLIFLLQLQKTILAFMGIKSDEAAKASGATAAAAKTANRECAAGFTAIVDAGADMLADAYQTLFSSPSAEEVVAAQRLQSWRRMRTAQTTWNQMRDAAICIQAWMRTAMARKRVGAYLALRKASWCSRSEMFWSRPGHEWLRRHEALILLEERIAADRDVREARTAQLDTQAARLQKVSLPPGWPPGTMRKTKMLSSNESASTPSSPESMLEGGHSPGRRPFCGRTHAPSADSAPNHHQWRGFRALFWTVKLVVGYGLVGSVMFSSTACDVHAQRMPSHTSRKPKAREDDADADADGADGD